MQITFMQINTHNILFLCVFALFATWPFLVINLARKLKQQIPDKYVELGSPSLGLGGDFKSTNRLLKFILTSQSNSLTNEMIKKRIKFMRIWFLMCIIGFILVIIFPPTQ